MGKTLVLAGLLGAIPVVGYGAVTGYAGPQEDTTPAKNARRARWSQSPLGRLIMGRRGRAMVLRSELNLTDEQRAKIGAIFKENRQSLAKVAQPVATERHKLRLAVLADAPNDEQIRQAAKALGVALGDAAVEMSVVAREVQDVFTEAQLKKVREFRNKNQQAVDGFFGELLSE